MSRGRIVVVDDDVALAQTLEQALQREGFGATGFPSPEQALRHLDTNEVDAVVTDLRMGQIGGLEFCRVVNSRSPDTPVIVITAFGSLESAIAAIRAGAYDFVTKPFETEVLALALDRAVALRRLREDVRRLKIEATDGSPEGTLIGKSPAIRRVHDLISRVKDSDVTVLITGESGTGKELVALGLHREGKRSAGPFVAINCAALPEALLESELFGHVRGAFTDAKTGRSGLFADANGGTLFLDEVGEMPVGVQAKLLRALQDRVVRPVGGSAEIPFDVRIVAATNRDLLAAVDEGRFREDLYFRLNVLEIPVPPLRSRGRDVLLLGQHFLNRSAGEAGKTVIGFEPRAAEKLLGYHWPGNVRELQNCVERAVALTRFDHVTVDDLPDRIRDFATSHVLVTATGPDELVPLAEVERRYILRVLEVAQGHRTAAAKILGLDRKTLYRKLERWGYPEGE